MEGAERTLTLDNQGTWSVSGLPVGRVHITVDADGYQPQETDANIAPSDNTTVIVRLSLKPDETRRTPTEAIEVTVRGERPAPAVSTFTRQEVRQLPGAFGDPFRAVEALPGVTPVFSGLPFFYIRGAPPADVGYFLDGVRVPYLFHLLLGPSVVQPGLVDRVDLYPGGYPARFGRFAGGIVSAETSERRLVPHGEGNLRLFDAGAMAETGFAGGRGSVLLGGRYSYTAALLSLVAPGLKLDYHDYQARISYDLSSSDRLTVFGFGSYDLLAQEQQRGLNVLFGSEFYRLDLRHDHSFQAGTLRTAVTLGYDQTRPPTTQRNVSNRSIGARLELHQRIASGVTLRAGSDVLLDAYRTSKAAYGDPEDPEAKSFDETFPSRDDVTLGARADLVLGVTRGIEVTPGLRVDRYQSGSASAIAVDPRISARFQISDNLKIVHAYGIVHQPPAFVIPLPALTPGKLEGGLQTAFQTSAGVEANLPEAITATVTLFNNVFFNMSDALGTNAGNNDSSSHGINRRSLGSAFGLEVFVRRNLTKRLGGFLSYTLSRSTRSAEGPRLPSAFDRTHVLNAAISYNLGRSWRAGARVLFYTGTPISGSSGGGQGIERNPPFYRVDVRLEKRWSFGDARWISFVAECMNVTLSKETFGNQEIGPITIPSIGVEGGF